MTGNHVDGFIRLKGSNPLLSVVIKYDPLVKWFKTLPFHGSNMGSNPVRVIYGGLAQLGERLPYKQRVTGSSPVPSIEIMVPWSSWFRTPACHAGDHEFESRWNR
jgi:hypothetical protein